MIDYQSNYHNSWALIVGINTYQYFPPLTYACNDADDIANILITELEFPAENVTLLKDIEATKKRITDEYLKFITVANHIDDRLLVFFAGHGVTVPGLRGNTGFLVPCDGEVKNHGSLIRWDDLTKNSDIIPAKHIFFIMDACYSGLALATDRGLSLGIERFVGDMLQRPVRQVITAGKANEKVADGGGGKGENSIFTGYLLQGLRGEANDEAGVLTGYGLMEYVYRKVGQDDKSNQTPQYGPVFGDGDFVFREPGGLISGASPSNDLLVKTAPRMPPDPSDETQKEKPSFATLLGYNDPTHPNFGRNKWTDKLYELRGGNTGLSYSKAFSWLSVIIEPNSNYPLEIDIPLEVQRLKNYQPTGDKPQGRLVIPRGILTTIDSLILFNQKERREINGDSNWESFMRITENGSMEYATSDIVFQEWETERSFQYVKLIGTIWQFIFFAKETLKHYEYEAGAIITINLVGTQGTSLIDFARGEGEKKQTWRQPDRSGFHYDFSKLICHDINLKMDYEVILKSFYDLELHQLIYKIATKLGQAYNHQSAPRCFNFNTDVFPWKQYFSGLY